MKKNLTKYVDGFVLIVPKKDVKAYTKMASDASKIWMKLGALGYMECMGDDLLPQTGGDSVMNFIKLNKAKPTDTVWFSYITYKSRAHRDSVMKKVNAYMEKEYADQKDIPMPFDLKKMAYGGFKVVVSA